MPRWRGVEAEGFQRQSRLGGESYDKFAAGAGSVTGGGDGAAVHFGQCLGDRLADSRSAFRASERSAWANSSKRRGSISGAMPIPLSRTRMSTWPSSPGSDLDASAGWSVFGGVGQDLHEDLLNPGRVGLEAQSRRVEGEDQLVLSLADQGLPHGVDDALGEFERVLGLAGFTAIDFAYKSHNRDKLGIIMLRKTIVGRWNVLADAHGRRRSGMAGPMQA